MSQKSLNRKAAIQFIYDKRVEGKTDQEIYYELTDQYFGKKEIAKLITGTPTQSLKDKYKIPHNILLGLIGLTIAFKIISIMIFIINDASFQFLGDFLFYALINIYIYYQVYYYNGSQYRQLGLLLLIYTLQTGRTDISLNFFINLIASIIIAVLLVYLFFKMFPNYNPSEMKKDEKGDYILE